MGSLKEIRTNSSLTQIDCAKLLGVSLRSYKEYENNPAKENTFKYNYLLDKINEALQITEEKGILLKKQIIEICKNIFAKYNVEYCYLFGSYAKGLANEKSDVDLVISLQNSGLEYFELVEELREKLHKKVDLLDTRQLVNNLELLDEILKTGEKIYG